MLTTNTAFDAKHAAAVKQPVYVLRFENDSRGFCNHIPTSGGKAIAPNLCTEVDTPGRITLTATRATVTNMDDDEDFYAYYDLGDKYFKGYIEIDFDFRYVNGNGGKALCFLLSDYIGEFYEIISNGGNSVGVMYKDYDTYAALVLYETGDNSSEYSILETINMQAGTVYYCRFKFTSTTITLEIYTDSERTTIYDVNFPLSLTLTKANGEDFRYFYPVCSHSEGAGGKSSSFYVENFNIRSYRDYLVEVSGLDQQITPLEGRSSISAMNFSLLDVNDEITALVSSDATYMHKKTVEIKGGYLGLSEDNFLTIYKGQVTQHSIDRDLITHKFKLTDAQKYLQRKIFRNATEDVPVTFGGNPVFILLRILTSTGAGTNGDYDDLEESNGLAIPQALVDVARIEAVRYDYYPGGHAHSMRFSIKEPVKAADFIEKELLRPIGAYLRTGGDGLLRLVKYGPPVAATTDVLDLTRDNTEPDAEWDANLEGMVNEVEFSYNYNTTTGEFDDITVYSDAVSIAARGAGNRQHEIESRGLTTSYSGASLSLLTADWITRLKNAIFSRFSNPPPPKINASGFFSLWHAEAGDIVSYANSKIPDISAGTRGLTIPAMEVTKISRDWKRGKVKMELLDTGFGALTYGAISGYLTIVGRTNRTTYTVVSAGSFAKFTLPELQAVDAKGRTKGSVVTLLTIDTATLIITVDDPGIDLEAGWMLVFPAWDSCTTEQQRYAFMADGSNYLGTGNESAQIIVP